MRRENGKFSRKASIVIAIGIATAHNATSRAEERKLKLDISSRTLKKKRKKPIKDE